MFSRIIATNFLSWERLEFEFQPGVTLIEGFNLDDQTSEGSGKSAILNALCWGLYGRIPKEAKIDDVVRDGHKSCEVVVELLNGTQIVRTRKPNDLYMHQFEVPSTQPIKGKDAKETQALIEKEVGMSFETFCQSVYFAQNYPNKFVTATEEDKVKILSEILDLKQYDRARATVMDRLRRLEVESAVSEKGQASIDMQLSSLDRQQKDYETLRDKLHREREERIINLTMEHDHLVKDLEALEARREALPQASLEDREKLAAFVQECEEVKKRVTLNLFELRQLAELRKERDRLHEVFTTLSAKRESFDAAAAELKLSEYRRDIELFQQQKVEITHRMQNIAATKRIKDETFKLHVRKLNDAKRLEAALEKLRNPGDQKCPTCGTVLSEADPSHMEVAILEKEQELRLANLEAKNVLNDLEAIVVHSDEEEKAQLQELSKASLLALESAVELQSNLRIHEHLVHDLDKTAERISEMDTKLLAGSQVSEQEFLDELAQLEAAISDARAQEQQLSKAATERDFIEKDHRLREGLLKKIEGDLERANAGASPEVDQKLEQLATERVEVLERQTALLKVLQAQRDQRVRLQSLREGFKEIKAYVFGNILSELTRKANRYLVELFEVPVSIEFSNLSDDGDMAKIRVAVTYDGSERPLGLYSGGQFRRIQLAVDLALSEIVSARGAKPLQLRVLDEYFKDLSETSMDKALHLLEKLPGSTVLIEHNSIFRSIVRNVFRLELEAWVSRRVA
jgi:DNA repair exonuclease SbcCD ATPase subunit